MLFWREDVQKTQERRNALFWLLADAVDELTAALGYLDPALRSEAPFDEREALSPPACPSLCFEHRASAIPALAWARSQVARRPRPLLH